jgi:hypothetical protein
VTQANDPLFGIVTKSSVECRQKAAIVPAKEVTRGALQLLRYQFPSMNQWNLMNFCCTQMPVAGWHIAALKWLVGGNAEIERQTKRSGRHLENACYFGRGEFTQGVADDGLADGTLGDWQIGNLPHEVRSGWQGVRGAAGEG